MASFRMFFFFVLKFLLLVWRVRTFAWPFFFFFFLSFRLFVFLHGLSSSFRVASFRVTFFRREKTKRRKGRIQSPYFRAEILSCRVADFVFSHSIYLSFRLFAWLCSPFIIFAWRLFVFLCFGFPPQTDENGTIQQPYKCEAKRTQYGIRRVLHFLLLLSVLLEQSSGLSRWRS